MNRGAFVHYHKSQSKFALYTVQRNWCAEGANNC